MLNVAAEWSPCTGKGNIPLQINEFTLFEFSPCKRDCSSLGVLLKSVFVLIELKTTLWTKVHGQNTWTILYAGSQTIIQAWATPLSPKDVVNCHPESLNKQAFFWPASVLLFHIVPRKDKWLPTLNSELISSNFLFNISRSYFSSPWGTPETEAKAA